MLGRFIVILGRFIVIPGRFIVILGRFIVIPGRFIVIPGASSSSRAFHRHPGRFIVIPGRFIVIPGRFIVILGLVPRNSRYGQFLQFIPVRLRFDTWWPLYAVMARPPPSGPPGSAPRGGRWPGRACPCEGGGRAMTGGARIIAYARWYQTVLRACGDARVDPGMTVGGNPGSGQTCSRCLRGQSGGRHDANRRGSSRHGGSHRDLTLPRRARPGRSIDPPPRETTQPEIAPISLILTKKRRFPPFCRWVRGLCLWRIRHSVSQMPFRCSLADCRTAVEAAIVCHRSGCLPYV